MRVYGEASASRSKGCERELNTGRSALPLELQLIGRNVGARHENEVTIGDMSPAFADG